LTWPYSREKIRRIIPLENIKYIVCQHPDPDITSGIGYRRPACGDRNGRSASRHPLAQCQTSGTLRLGNRFLRSTGRKLGTCRR
jgi:hypothetical protein